MEKLMTRDEAIKKVRAIFGCHYREDFAETLVVALEAVGAVKFDVLPVSEIEDYRLVTAVLLPKFSGHFVHEMIDTLRRAGFKITRQEPGQ
jgi:hypothetical protein